MVGQITTPHSKLGLIALFLQHDLDMIEAVRTAPYHSWKNPCERVNCILNLGLQAVGLMRARMEEKFEYAISNCNSISEVHEAVRRTAGLKEALQDSVEPVKVLVHSVFSRLTLKDKPVLGYSAATDHEMDAFFNILEHIEPEITKDDRAKECFNKRPQHKEFIAHCCHERKYAFGIKKCGESGCSICQPPQLPQDVFNKLHHIPDPVPENDQHYNSFAALHGTPTMERDGPSTKKEDSRKEHGILFNPNGQTARATIMCSECLRPRVIYSQYKLNHIEQVALSRTIESLLYMWQ